ncbi:YxeA family protein [Lentilactobacillus raoultii]|uniref:YxeA family protein n=1 Tax=Lentilactobacillus raoultii TaxID=1987503 RepID=A0ABW3PMD0_9LACO|nr:YxeA family protein [Lentilactobacillus raoultii]
MKKGTLYTIIVLVVLAVVGGVWYHQNYGKTYYYGQVGNLARTEKESGGPDAYYYKITGYNQNGQAKRMEVGSFQGHKFVKGRYIKIGWSKKHGVMSYEQTTWKKIPKKAQSKLPKPVYP